MTEPLLQLMGKKVIRAQSLHDYVQLFFERDEILNIYNELAVPDELPKLLDGLVGSGLAGVQERENLLILRFDNGAELKVSMRDDAYRGPEAMQLITPGKPTVVW